MLTPKTARALVENTLHSQKVIVHSLFVGEVMAWLAERLAGDVEVWTMTGICHDIDIEVIAGDFTQHGPKGAEMLAGQLPDEALHAIAAHHFEANVVSHTLLADMLKLADATTLVDYLAGRERAQLMESRSATSVMDEFAPGKPHLSTPIDTIAARHGIALQELVAMLRAMPEQKVWAA